VPIVRDRQKLEPAEDTREQTPVEGKASPTADRSEPTDAEAPAGPAAPAPEASPPQAEPAETALVPGQHTATVVRYNFKEGGGTLRLDDGTEIDIRRTQLRRGVRFLVANARVSFTVVAGKDELEIRDIAPID